MTDSDEILVGRAQRGEHAAFEELVRRTSRLVFARLFLETGDSHQSEDLLQETHAGASDRQAAARRRRDAAARGVRRKGRTAAAGARGLT